MALPIDTKTQKRIIKVMKNMNHIEYPKSLKTKTDEQLRFIMKDAKEAIDAMPEGENAGYYADEICYCADELYRRRGQK